MGKNPEVRRKPFPPQAYHDIPRSARDQGVGGHGPERRWDGRVKMIDVLGAYFSPGFDLDEKIEGDTVGHLAEAVEAPKPRPRHRGRKPNYGGEY